MPLPKSNHYIPGMICLIALPAAFILYMLKPAEKQIYHCLEVKYESNRGCCEGCVLQEREYRDITLTGDPIRDKEKLDSSRALLRRIHNGADSTIAHFSLSNTATYGTFVMALNVFLEEKIDNYVLDEAGIWFGKDLPELRKPIYRAVPRL